MLDSCCVFVLSCSDVFSLYVLDLSQPRCSFCWIRCGLLCHVDAAVARLPSHEPDRSQHQTKPPSAKGIANLCSYQLILVLLFIIIA